ncbi:MAG: hypothetical protein OEX02_03275 [Cyclobacteriaceae bacterium]|nr:hypothetical protein [Cyclobacteriaceae bacterium]
MLFLISVALSAFCIWGLFTDSGTSAFSGMNGLLPYMAGVIAVLIYFSMFLIWLYRFLMQKG